MDINLLKLINFGTQPVTFRARYDAQALAPLLAEIKGMYRVVTALPFYPRFTPDLQRELRLKEVYASAALGGNPLGESGVGEVMRKSVADPNLKRIEKEVLNLAAAVDFLADQVKNAAGTPLGHSILSEEDIKTVHTMVTVDIPHRENVPGRYREGEAMLVTAENLPAAIPGRMVAKTMHEFVNWLNSKEVLELDPAVRAALAHYHLAVIRPFGDGNGRTARLVESLLLDLADVRYVPRLLPQYYLLNKEEYRRTIAETAAAEGDDVTPFLRFVFTGFLRALDEVREYILADTRRRLLRASCDELLHEKALNARQHALVLLLLDREGGATLDDLMRKSPFSPLYRRHSDRTARRDLQHLAGLKLVRSSGREYSIDFSTVAWPV